MKKILSFFFIPFLLIFTQGCQSGTYMDICMFSDRFNKIYGSEKIIYNDSSGLKNDNEMTYEIYFDEENYSKKLICASSDKNLNLTEISLTLDKKNISEAEKKRFSEISKIITDVYTQGLDDYESVLKNLNENMYESENGYSSYFDTHRYSYFIVCNDAGMIFSVKSILLNEAESENLTLRQ